MIFRELQLLAFGAFTNHTLDFSARPRGLHIVFGPNEAGKSTALRALTALLFGIPSRTRDNFRHDYQRLRVGGILQRADGSEVALVRRKGNANTLLDPLGGPLEDAVLLPFLGGVTADQFTAMFGINHATLRAGGEAILLQGGEVGQSLFAASMGSAAVQTLLTALESEADELFRPRGREQLINATVRDYDDTVKRQRDLSLSNQSWEQQRRVVLELQGRQQVIGDALTQLTRAHSQLLRIKSVLPGLARRREALLRLGELANVRLLPTDFEQEVTGIQATLTRAGEAETRAQAAITRVEAELATLCIPTALLAEAEAISELHQRLGSYQKAHQDRGRLEGQLLQVEAVAAQLLPELPDTPALEDARAMWVSKAQRVRLRELGDHYQRLVADRTQGDRALHKLLRELANGRQRLDALPPARDCGDVRVAIERGRQHGDLEELRRRAHETLLSREAEAARMLTQLRLPALSCAAADALLVPSLETVERFATDRQLLEGEATRVAERQAEFAKTLRAVRESLEALRLAGAVPTEEALQASRTYRDRGWQLVRHAWSTGAPDAAAAAAYAAAPLADAYEQAVIAADVTADRMRRETERVTRYATLLAQQGRVEEELARIADELAANGQAQQAWHDAWTACWHPSGVTPLTPGEMHGWLVRYHAFVQQSGQVRAQHEEVTALTQRIAAARAALALALTDLGEAAPAVDEPLATVLTRAQRVVERLTEDGRQRTEQEKHQVTLQEEVAGHQDEATRLTLAWEQWHLEWASAVELLHLPAATSPGALFAVLDTLDAIHKALAEADGYRKRIDGIDRDAEAFAEAVTSLVGRLGEAGTAQELEKRVKEMYARLTAARRDVDRREAGLAHLTEQRDLLREAHETLTLKGQRLAELCRLAACARPEELQEAIKANNEKAALQRALGELEQDLLRQGDGRSLAELADEAAPVNADDLPGQLAEVARQITEGEGERSALDRQIGEAEAALKTMDGASQAAEAATEAQSLLAGLRAPVERYLRVRVAARLLRQAIESYRAANQSPVLARAGALFHRLTLEAFAGVGTDFNERDEPILIGQRASGEAVPVEGMSEGTLDALYLALRLATLERHFTANEPLPFIVDDILITFDDARARAALAILAEFAQQIQVIFFTHHAHLVDLAQGAAGPEVVLHTLAPAPVAV
jgi:uncharacterized protein YhaN